MNQSNLNNESEPRGKGDGPLLQGWLVSQLSAKCLARDREPLTKRDRQSNKSVFNQNNRFRNPIVIYAPHNPPFSD